MASNYKLSVLIIIILTSTMTSVISYNYITSGLNKVPGESYFDMKLNLENVVSTSIGTTLNTSFDYFRSVQISDNSISNISASSGNERYKFYMLDKNSLTLKNSFYVIWDMAFDNCLNNNIISFKIRFFYCQDSAIAFFNSKTNTNKIVYDGSSFTETKDLSTFDSNLINYIRGTNYGCPP